MGQTQIEQKQKQSYQLVEQLSVGNIIKYNKSQSLCFIKEYSFTSQQSYQNTLNNYSLKLSNKNEHILNFKHFTTKSQNSFCSTFYKIILIFQYIDYTLEKQVNNRIKDNQPFNEKQIWSILCSSVLASVHLIHCQNKMHCGLTTKDIRLNSSGCVKLLHHQMIGIQSSHSQKQGVPKTLALTLIQCMSLEKLNNQENSYLEKVIERLEYSRQMKDMLLMMINKDAKFTQIEQHLFKLVQDDDSLPRQSLTPPHKLQSPLGSNHKYSKSLKNQCSMRNSKVHQEKCEEIEPLPYDCQDSRSSLHTFEMEQIQRQIPDETQKEIIEEQQQDVEEESPHKVDPFTIQISKKEQNSDKDRKKLSAHKQNESQSHRQYQSSYKKSDSNITSERQIKKQQHLFTDPKLFSLFRNELEEIKMRISTVEFGKFSKSQQLKNCSNNEIESNHQYQNTKTNNIKNNNYNENCLLPITNDQNLQRNVIQKQNTTPQKNSARKQQKIITNYGEKQQNCGLNQFNNIQIIKQVSQQYREEDDDKNQSISCLKPIQNINKKQNNSKDDRKREEKPKEELIKKQQIQNILNNNQIGFKKKKQYGKLQTEKQNITHQSLRTISERQKQEHMTKSIKSQKNSQSKSKSFKIKLNETKNINHDNKSQIFDSNSGRKNNSASFSNRIQKDDRNVEKLVHVNQKYNRGRYQGTKLNGKRQGQGTFYYSEGGKYVGHWKQNKMHGKGILYYPNQQIAYDGEWQYDQLSGYGTLYNEQVTSLKIPFDYRDWSDVQDYWVKYQGHFYQDNKDGKGKLYLSNGQRLEGEFHDDKVDGDGVLYRGDGSSVKGKWRQNKLVRLF